MKTKEYLHVLQDGSAVSFKDPAGVFEGLVNPSADVSHPYGHLSYSSQAHFVVFLQQGNASNTVNPSSQRSGSFPLSFSDLLPSAVLRNSQL